MTGCVEQRILLTSGPIAAGKSGLVEHLQRHHGFLRISSGDFLRERARLRGEDGSRLALVRMGDLLDQEKDFRWVADPLARRALAGRPEHALWVFDSIRKNRQARHFRAVFPGRILHVHLSATDDVLKARYEERQAGSDRATAYEVAIDTDNEREARGLAAIADIVTDSAAAAPETLAARIAEEFGTWSRSS